MKRKYYVAYGSNLNIEQMSFRCPRAKLVGTSMIKGYELLFKGSKTGAYLTIEKRKGSEVPVGIWSVSEEDEEALDRYEGYPNFYYKQELTLPIKDIKSGEVKERECFVYIMDEQRVISIPSKYYIETCLLGYKDFDFDYKYLIEAAAKSRMYLRVK